ncbi:hypothetical protein [Streptomyces sp. NPDC000880]
MALATAALLRATGALVGRVPFERSLGLAALIRDPLGRVVLGRQVVDSGLAQRGLVGWSRGLPRNPDRRRGGPRRTGAHRAYGGE